MCARGTAWPWWVGGGWWAEGWAARPALQGSQQMTEGWQHGQQRELRTGQAASDAAGQQLRQAAPRPCKVCGAGWEGHEHAMRMAAALRPHAQLSRQQHGLPVSPADGTAAKRQRAQLGTRHAGAPGLVPSSSTRQQHTTWQPATGRPLRAPDLVSQRPNHLASEAKKPKSMSKRPPSAAAGRVVSQNGSKGRLRLKYMAVE